MGWKGSSSDWVVSKGTLERMPLPPSAQRALGDAVFYLLLEITIEGSHHLPCQGLVGGEDAKSRPMIQVLGPGGRGTEKNVRKW